MVVRRRSSSSAARAMVLASISMSRPLSIVYQETTARGFEQRDGGAQLVRPAGTHVVDGGRKLVRLEARQPRDSGAAVLARQVLVPANSSARRFTERTHRRRVQRLTAAETHCEVARAADLLGQ